MKYKVNVEELLSRIVEVEAENEFEEQYNNMRANYENEYKERYRLDSENRELKRTNDKLLDIIKNLSEGIAAK